MGIFRKSTAEFYQLELGQLSESSTNVDQKAYIVGRLGLSLDRRHVTRTLPTLWDLIAFAGGLSFACYLVAYALIIVYQRMHRQAHIIGNIFYYNESVESKSRD